MLRKAQTRWRDTNRLGRRRSKTWPVRERTPRRRLPRSKRRRGAHARRRSWRRRKGIPRAHNVPVASRGSTRRARLRCSDGGDPQGAAADNAAKGCGVPMSSGCSGRPCFGRSMSTGRSPRCRCSRRPVLVQGDQQREDFFARIATGIGSSRAQRGRIAGVAVPKAGVTASTSRWRRAGSRFILGLALGAAVAFIPAVCPPSLSARSSPPYSGASTFTISSVPRARRRAGCSRHRFQRLGSRRRPRTSSGCRRSPAWTRPPPLSRPGQ